MFGPVFLLVMQRLPPNRTLAHHCLRTFALHWEELSEFEQYYLPTIPISLREALLSYLAAYGAKACLDFRSFKLLFQNEEGTGTSSWDEVRFLDLTGLLNETFTIADVGKCLKRQPSHLPNVEALQIDDSSKAKSKEKAVQVADSWEEEADESATARGKL